MNNISDLLYNFIDSNSGLFDLTRYDVDHSMNFELLNYYVRKQTCSRKYFELLKYIYEQSTLIDCKMFEKHYINNIIELNEKYGDRELIVLFPYLQTDKSNFFLTLYFLHLCKSILGKQINYVFPYIKEDPISHEIAISELALTKPPLIVLCDDFSYSGEQLSLNIAYLPFIRMTDIKVYLCIIGMTSAAKPKFDKTLMMTERDKKIHGMTKYSSSYDVIFPTHSLIIDKTFESVIFDKIVSNKLYNPDTFLLSRRDVNEMTGIEDLEELKKIKKSRQIFNYLLLNDMYIIEFEHDDLYAVGQLHKLYNDLKNTIVYLFFKYPDWLSTIPEMCALFQYPNNYRVSIDKLGIDLDAFSEMAIEDYPTYPNYYEEPLINKFGIETLFKTPEDYDEVKANIRDGTPINKTKFDWIENCPGYDFKLDGVSFVTIDGNPRIELIRNLKKTFNTVYISTTQSLCNDSIFTFYKHPILQEIFSGLKQNIKSITRGGNRTKHYIRINKKYTIKKNKKSRKPRKSLRRVK